MDSGISPKETSSPMRPTLANSPIKRESPEPSICCSPTSSLKAIPQINGEKKEMETTAISVKDHRQMMQRSFCIESLLKPATAEALKIVVTSDMERKKSPFSPPGGAPVSPPSSPQSPSSSSSAAAGPTITTSNAPFINGLQGLPRASPLAPPSALFPSHPAMYQGYPNIFSVPPPHGLGPNNAGGGLPSSEGPATSPANPTPTHHSLEGVLKSNHTALNMQTMQLEWLARTGMLYHRFPELAGKLYDLRSIISLRFLFLIHTTYPYYLRFISCIS